MFKSVEQIKVIILIGAKDKDIALTFEIKDDEFPEPIKTELAITSDVYFVNSSMTLSIVAVLSTYRKLFLNDHEKIVRNVVLFYFHVINAGLGNPTHFKGMLDDQFPELEYGSKYADDVETKLKSLLAFS